ncbi:MAG TPA: CDP-alcohol phosphatidyltransferase family protein [Anaerolineaceae bacterium]|nr:CDP-alcohol phosphatidyltransferase family protein [Anaerolineaceae bacterium]
MAKKIRTEKDKRTNDILLGPLERPALAFFARHMPKWVNSDMLTVLGLLGSVLAAVAYALVGLGEVKDNPWLFVASLGFVINWFGDSLDGTLARFRNVSRPNYGYYTDHAIDGITTLLVFGGIGLSGIARFDVSLIAMCAWLLLMMQVFLKTHATGIFEMTSVKIGPTEMRLIIIILNTVLFFIGAGGSLFEVTLASQVIPVNIGTLVLGIFAILFLGYYIYQIISTGSQLAYEDGEALKRRQLGETVDKKLTKAEKKAVKKAKKHANSVQNGSSGVTI